MGAPRRVSGAIALLLTLAFVAPATGAHAIAPREQSVGQWAYLCRVQQINTAETITVGADTNPRAPLGDLAPYAARTCATFDAAASSPYDNGYQDYPLSHARPGVIVCAAVLRYGGYWQELAAPYTNSLGGLVVAVRDTPEDTSPDGSGQTYGQNDCNALYGAFSEANVAAGYNPDLMHPLATIQNCEGCGGGGAAPRLGGSLLQLPKTPHSRHPARKPYACVTLTPGQRNTTRLPTCKK